MLGIDWECGFPVGHVQTSDQFQNHLMQNLPPPHTNIY
jgi:hypothetical protein